MISLNKAIVATAVATALVTTTICNFTMKNPIENNKPKSVVSSADIVIEIDGKEYNNPGFSNRLDSFIQKELASQLEREARRKLFEKTNIVIDENEVTKELKRYQSSEDYQQTLDELYSGNEDDLKAQIEYDLQYQEYIEYIINKQEVTDADRTKYKDILSEVSPEEVDKEIKNIKGIEEAKENLSNAVVELNAKIR